MGPIRSLEELRSTLARWDQASRPQREKLLRDFIKNGRNMTGPELEKEFGNGASLFLTRICAYLRTSYMSGGPVGLALQAISIFVGAASGHRFLVEFIEGGGLPVVAEILRKDSVSEGDRMKALQLLSNIASAGHTYKQMIGDLNGIKAVCDFIKSAKADPAHELARGLLVNLGRGNKRSDTLHRYLIDLLHTEQPEVQRTAAQVLRQLLSPSKVEGVAAASPDPDLVGAVCRMFCSNQVHVLYEAQELGIFALGHKATSDNMIRSTIAMLRPDPYTYSSRPSQTPADADLYGNMMASTAFFDDMPPPETLLCQSAGARLIASFINGKHADHSGLAVDTILEKMIELGGVASLLVTAANPDFLDSKKNGSMALVALIKRSHAADKILYQVTGPTFHESWHADPTGCTRTLDYDKVNRLFRETGHGHLQYFRDGHGPAHTVAESSEEEEGAERDGADDGAREGTDENVDQNKSVKIEKQPSSGSDVATEEQRHKPQEEKSSADEISG